MAEGTGLLNRHSGNIIVSSNLTLSAKITKELYMSKLSDTLKRALEKKQGISHIEGDDTPQVEKKQPKTRVPVIGKKPPTRSAGRGR